MVPYSFFHWHTQGILPYVEFEHQGSRKPTSSILEEHHNVDGPTFGATACFDDLYHGP